MTKSEIAKSMEAYVGGCFITRDELAKYMGYKAVKSVDRYLYGLEKINKKYFIQDVAEELTKSKVY